jgi:beta-N-acetylhexosaminidase
LTPSADGSVAGASGPRAFITGLAGTTLGDEEARFLAETRPCGIIIFSRNFHDDAQLRELIDAASAAIGTGHPLVLVDQEGGRVQRLRGGAWPNLPPAARYGALFSRDRNAALDAVRTCMHGLGLRLRAVGINTNCAPCLDVPVAGADDVIGDRAFGGTPDMIAALGGAAAEGLLAAGVVPVIKHIPGHGRALVDSHKALPVVRASRADLAARDFVPFAALAGMPAAMTAHVTFEAIDLERPASISPVVTQDVIRDEIGFGGLLISDDISMGALSGTVGDRAQKVLEAGSDVVLHCNGNLAEMREVAAQSPVLVGTALARYERCVEIVAGEGVAVPARVFEAALALVSGDDEAGAGDA